MARLCHVKHGSRTGQFEENLFYITSQHILLPRMSAVLRQASLLFVRLMQFFVAMMCSVWKVAIQFVAVLTGDANSVWASRASPRSKRSAVWVNVMRGVVTVNFWVS